MEDTRKVYLDYSATTPTDPRVVEEMIPYFTEHFGNPSSIYSTGLEAKDAIEHAREQVAHLINAEPKELIFTSGGTESDNWALIATAHRLQHKGKHNISNRASRYPSFMRVPRKGRF